MNTKVKATLFAILAAALYAINIPFSKILLNAVSPTVMAGFLYLGAGVGMAVFATLSKLLSSRSKKEHLTRKELPYTIMMVLLDIAAPILLMLGLNITTSANATLLNNFEIVATSVIALVIFKESVSPKLRIAIGLVTLAGGILTFEGNGALNFNHGSLFVLGACVCWGLENNCTRMLSKKSSEEIVVIKGIFSGLGSLVVALIIGECFPAPLYVVAVMVLGFVSYGLSINFYINAQKYLGAAKTSAYYSIAPFLGVAFSMLFVGERPDIQFYIALLIIVLGTYLMIRDTFDNVHE